MKAQDQSISRREFMATTAAAAGVFTIVPRYVLGGPKHTPPSEKLNLAGIGCGGQGASDLNALSSQNIVALCDVDQHRAGGAFAHYPDARRYSDFREMLDKEADVIDAVVVATPDHTHAVATMAALNQGLHVYCEKPLTHSVTEARLIAQAAREKGLATQMGNQGQASEETRRICEFIWAGAIGPVREVHIWTDRPNCGLLGEYWPQGVNRPADTPPVPEHLNWDLWLGPAPQRPYHPAYLPAKWRGWWDFGTGALGDIGCHSFDPAWRALKLDYPKTIQAVSTRVNSETYPLGSIVRYEFSPRGDMPACSLTWYDGGMKPPRPAELEQGLTWPLNGTLFVGDRGKMLGHRIIPEKQRKEVGDVPRTLERSPGHHAEWIAACKGQKPAGSNFDHAGPMTEAVLLGNIPLRMELREPLQQTNLAWDPHQMKFTNLDQANAFLHRTYRPGWNL